uniref:uncharacterized protein LOC108950622 isoform X2 n=1 Tax=Ciona intestinalis TaxID=7719 RepID=UPI000EF52739|nr:uncharacterized protein LOC108950622 isoform X2 [Ciona intestinalis]|eukprot:XP_026695364.1 uncharacterized protein LOC108950622 isoform X2 [Ciona intestinalis]
MNVASCCDVYCTSCRIWYLSFLRPGDSVPFKKPKLILPLGVAKILIATVVIILDCLALFCQTMGMTSPPPSFLGSPGFPLWISLLVIPHLSDVPGLTFFLFQFIFSGCCNVVAFKRNSRFTTAIAFGSSCLSTIVIVVLLCVVTMAVAEELSFYQLSHKGVGVVISSIICLLVLSLLAVTSSSSLLCYVALTSHDDRWFTDRGTQCDSTAPSTGGHECASLTIPSNKPAFVFYAPSDEAAKYTSAFRDVIRGLETKDKLDREFDDVKTPDSSEDGVAVIEVDGQPLPGNYLHST